MYELKVTVTKVMGKCTADPPMKPGDHFFVCDGDIRIPPGGYVCLWALQNLIPLLTPKEREIAEKHDEDWMWRVHHAQCPDPNGRVIFKIEQIGRVDRGREAATAPAAGAVESAADGAGPSGADGIKSLRVKVESVGGHCTSRMKPGDQFTLRKGRLYIQPDRHFCLYALQAALPLLPAKQRPLQDGDWLRDECRVLCPDPAGNVILHIESME